jgi:CO dehydrogenase/acetyl-CoA synthase epsilon subunit
MISIDDARRVTSREELAEFVARLKREVITHPDDVENETLGQYLEALGAYLHDLPGFVRNNNWPGTAEEVTWALVASLLAGAVIYE